MKLYGLTGGVGMGKSTAGELLQRRGVAVVDTDVLAREVVEPGQPALAEVAARFGSQVLHPNGRLNRDELAGIVFASADARHDLEAILHPRIRSAWLKRVEDWKREGKDMGVVIIPLLFETDSGSLFDTTVCVACSDETQWNRLSNRGWRPEQIRQRIAAQWPVAKKLALADAVIWTDTTLESHAAQLERIFGCE